MKPITTFAEARQRLQSFIVKPNAEPYTLDRMRALMRHIGDPQHAMPVIHVAGTSGKTSTCYYTAAILRNNNLKVGLAVSPYIDEVNERVQVGDQPLTEVTYCSYLTDFLQLVEASHLQPTYFEVLVAFSMWVFAQEKMDIMVLEVGVGGLLDTTNIIERPKACAITDIGFDHTEILGDAIEEIAVQKAGIITVQSAVVMHQQDDVVMRAVQAACQKHHAQLGIIPRNDEAEDSVIIRNWQLACRLAEAAAETFSLGKLDIPSQPLAITIPGRFEVLKLRGKTVIVDGAHNPQKLHRFVQTLLHAYPNESFQLILSFGKKKLPTIIDSLQILRQLQAPTIITEYHLEETAPSKAIPAAELAHIATEQGLVNATSEADLRCAINQALDANVNSIIVVTGSFFLATNLHQLYKTLR